MDFGSLRILLATLPQLELAVVIGSRATGTSHSGSDWDIAIQWQRDLSFIEQLAVSEKLRNELSKILSVSEQEIDLIDLPTARLAMRAVIAEEGVALKGGDSLAWHRFLQRTWRELEDQYWEKIYAA